MPDGKKYFLKMSQHLNYRSIYQKIFKAEPPESVLIEQSKTGIISKARGFVNAFDFTMQVQVGCPGGCLFCYVPTADQLTSSFVTGEQGNKWGFLVRNKENVPERLKKHLEKGELAGKTIYWSGVTDPYAAPPPVTRALWQTLIAVPVELRPRRIIVQTRFRPDRDTELITEYNETTISKDGGPPVLISYSVGTDRNDLIKAWEKSTPLFEQRMKTIESLRQAELFVVTTLSPLGLWDDLPSTLKQLKAWRVAYLTCLFFKENTSSANTPPLFLKYLREQFPVVLDRKWQAEQVREMRDVYGNNLVLIGKAGFTSLANPQTVIGNFLLNN